jgi:hypothetical protein
VIRIRSLPPRLRKKLKKPLGLLFHGSLEETMTAVHAFIEKEKPPKIIAVGDQVSKDLAENSVALDILIVDNRIMRQQIPPIPASADKNVRVKNPPGTITDEAWSAIEKATADSQRTKIVVDGEEDLLALVAIIAAPEDSLVLYGQPHRGIVVVKATAEIKHKVRTIVGAMERH